MMKIIPTEEEVRLLKCFSGDYWNQRARKYRMNGTEVVSASVTESGVVADISLNGETTLDELKKQIPRIRIILDVLDSDLLDVVSGGRGTRAQIAVRTRRITDTMDMLWHPGITSLGVDTITGEEIDVPWDQRILFSGSSGSGKSRSTRPVMARAVVDPQHMVSAFVDGKGEDATEWRGVVPVAVDDDEIIDAIELEYAEMIRRKKIMSREGIGSWDLSLGPRRLFVVDEGQVVLAIVKAEDKRRGRVQDDDEEFDPDDDDVPVEQKLIRLSSQARTREQIMIWSTQYAITGGPAPGITNLIRANFDYSFCLRVNSRKNTEVALGEDCGVFPHKLPRETWVRGHGYLNTHNENLIRTWNVPKESIRSLADFR
ncbi:hypothetical protein [Streptomyces sp. 5-10]|uniref:hypothetical protein n=1 Tax=Streptomyces sp. 5-10 TaxID=878925 RepID=UPI00168AA855|nr:hypothetical protein [Streptomyces sp. 5-10]MBD3004784.1 hypothetical protein [Streptomyces sp. 5-10]